MIVQDCTGLYFEKLDTMRIPQNALINVYSSVLNPREQQPNGSCNVSRIDNATNITIKPAWSRRELQSPQDYFGYVWVDFLQLIC